MVSNSRAQGRAPQLRPLNVPRPVKVGTDRDGNPIYVEIDGKRRRIAAVRERWRIDDEWWRVCIAREYANLAMEDGRLITVYRDVLTERWFVHFDSQSPRRVSASSRPDALRNTIATPSARR